MRGFSPLLVMALLATAQTPKPRPDSEDPGPPVLKRGGSTERKSPKSDLPPLVKTPPPDPDSPPPAREDAAPPPATEGARVDLIDRARVVSTDYDSGLPDFICDQLTLRYVSKTLKPDWKLKDRVQAELLYFDRREEYRNIRINDKVLKKGTPEDSGTWSTGDFGTTLVDVLSHSTNAKFQKRAGGDSISGVETAVYNFTVEQPNSHWEVRFAGSVKPAYQGTLWIDAQSARIMRIEMQARNLPATYALDKVEMTVEYGWVTIAGKKYLLPTDSQNLACFRGTFECTRNDIEFRNYRKFSSESNISTTDSNVSFEEEKPSPPKSEQKSEKKKKR